MTAAVIGTVTLLIAQFPIQTLGASILAHVATDARWAAAVPCHRVTAGTVPTLAPEGTVPAEGPLRTSFVADDPCPAIRAVTPALLRLTHPSIRTVITRQAAVRAERVIQAHKGLGERALGPQLSQVVILVVLVALQRLRGVVPQQGDLGQGPLHSHVAAPPQRLYRLPQGNAGESVLVKAVPQATEALEGSGCVLAGVLTASVVHQTLIYIITATSIRIEAVTSPTITLVTPRIVGTVLLTAGGPCVTLVQVHTGLKVFIQVVAMVTAANRSEG